MDNDFTENELIENEIEYYENKRDNRDFIVRVTVCQMILCAVFVGCIFSLCHTSEEIKQKITESLDYLQSGNISEEIQTVKDYINFDAQI